MCRERPGGSPAVNETNGHFMKIGIFSDVHADLDSLNRALKLMENKGADRLLCAGDLVDGDTEGDAAAQRVKNLNIPVVMGNHDLAFSQPRGVRWMQDIAPLLYKKNPDDRVSIDTANYLASLPHPLEIQLDEKWFLLAHGSPWDLASYVFPTAGSHHKLRRIAHDYPDVDVVILGHTHVPMAAQVGSLWIFNPGSVERNRYSFDRTCAMLDTSNMDYRVYDIDTGSETTLERVTLTLDSDS